MGNSQQLKPTDYCMLQVEDTTSNFLVIRFQRRHPLLHSVSTFLRLKKHLKTSIE